MDLTIENGEFFGLLGTNGAGKTTMIRILSTLMLPTSGCVMADGQRLTRNHVELKKKITVMTQEYTLRNDMSIEEILEYQGRLYRVPRQERQTRAVELMKLTGLYDHRKKLIRHLSGGMKRKVMLCRALLPKPEIILLDEPSLGLAPIIVEDIFKKIVQINKENNTTILLVEQNSRLALNTASRGYVLQNGEIALEGTSQELLNDVRVQHAYLGVSG